MLRWLLDDVDVVVPVVPVVPASVDEPSPPSPSALSIEVWPVLAEASETGAIQCESSLTAHAMSSADRYTMA